MTPSQAPVSKSNRPGASIRLYLVPWDSTGTTLEFSEALRRTSSGSKSLTVEPSSTRPMRSVAPVAGMKATLLDGSYHPVDSSEMAFIMAAKLAYKAAVPEAGPVLLEPVGALKAHVPADNTGDIMGEVTKRRGPRAGHDPR